MSQESSGSDTPRQGEGDVVRAQTEGGGGVSARRRGAGVAVPHLNHCPRLSL